MPVSLRLQENGHILHWKFTDPWSLSDLTALYPQVKVHFDLATYLVHSLLDFEGAHHLPSNALSARKTSTWNHPRSGQTAVAGSTAFIRGMLEIVFRLVGFDRVKFFEHETEARSYLLGLIAAETEAMSRSVQDSRENVTKD